MIKLTRYEKILGFYNENFPGKAALVEHWEKLGNNSIKLEFKNGRTEVFTYSNINEWKVRTLETYLRERRND